MQELISLHASLAASAAQVQYAHQQVLGKADPADVPVNQNTRRNKGAGKGSKKRDSDAQQQGDVAIAHDSGEGMQAHAGTAPGAPFKMLSKMTPRSSSMSEAGFGAHPFPAAARIAFDPMQHRHSIANHHIPHVARPYDSTGGEVYHTTAHPYDVDGNAYGTPAPTASVYFPYDQAPGAPAQAPSQYDGQSAYPAAAPSNGAPHGTFPMSATGYDVYGSVANSAAPPQPDPMYNAGMGFYSNPPRANSYHATTAWNGEDQWGRRETEPGAYGQAMNAAYPNNDRYGPAATAAAAYGAYPTVQASYPVATGILPFSHDPRTGLPPVSPFATRPNSSHGPRSGSPSDRPTLPPLSSLSRPGTAGGRVQPPTPTNASFRDADRPLSSRAANGYSNRLPSRGGRGDALALDAGSTSLASYGTSGKLPAFPASNSFGQVDRDPPRLPSRSGLSALTGMLSDSRSRRNSVEARQHSPDGPNASPFHFQVPALKRAAPGEEEEDERERKRHHMESESRPPSRRVSIAELCGQPEPDDQAVDDALPAISSRS